MVKGGGWRLKITDFPAALDPPPSARHRPWPHEGDRPHAGAVAKNPDKPVTPRTNDPANCLVISVRFCRRVGSAHRCRAAIGGQSPPYKPSWRFRRISARSLCSQADSSVVSSSRIHRRTSSAVTGRNPLDSTARISPLGRQPFDDDSIVISPPDLRHPQRRVDRRAVGLWPRDVHLDRQVRVGNMIEVGGSAFLRRRVLGDLLRKEVIALIRLEPTRYGPSLPGGLAQPFAGNPRLPGDDADEPIQHAAEVLVVRPLRHDLDIPPVVIDVDIAHLGDRVHQLLIKGPIHAAVDDAAVGDLGEPVDLVERRDARDGAGDLERGRPLGDHRSRRGGHGDRSWEIGTLLCMRGPGNRPG